MQSVIEKKVLRELKRGGWRSTVNLAHKSNSFATHSAVSRLRERGYNIASRSTNNPKYKHFYKLVRDF